ncbi:MAG TPA: hypothetical protein VMW72_10150 [Sedimentisphaerales bacterium]|nr:hypothetical protein [Sedimentisphaerales bacterium]
MHSVPNKLRSQWRRRIPNIEQGTTKCELQELDSRPFGFTQGRQHSK